MWIFSILGFLGLTFAFLLRQRELGPHGHGLETITTTAKVEKPAAGANLPIFEDCDSKFGIGL